MITSPFTIILTDIEQARLTKLTCSTRAEHRLVLRARIVLAAAQETSNAAIAVETGLHVDTVRKWRRRFVQHRLAGLADRRRSGRPPSFTPVQVAEVKQLACTLPAETGVALSRRSSSDLAAETVRRGVATSISASRLPAAGSTPMQSNPGSTGPGSSPATPTSPPRPPGCWTSTPAAGTANRSAPTTTSSAPTRMPTPSPPPPPPRTGSPTRPNPAGQVRVPPRRHPRLPSRLRRPPRPRDRTHRTQDRDRTLHPAGRAGHDQRTLRLRAPSLLDRRQRLLPPRLALNPADGTSPSATLVHLPFHASWLNEIEIYFSIPQRKAITPADFTDLDHLTERIPGFQGGGRGGGEERGGPLQPHRHPIPLALHPHRPQQLPPPHRLRRITPDELPAATTSVRTDESQ